MLNEEAHLGDYQRAESAHLNDATGLTKLSGDGSINQSAGKRKSYAISINDKTTAQEPSQAASNDYGQLIPQNLDSPSSLEIYGSVLRLGGASSQFTER